MKAREARMSGVMFVFSSCPVVACLSCGLLRTVCLKLSPTGKRRCREVACAGC